MARIVALRAVLHVLKDLAIMQQVREGLKKGAAVECGYPACMLAASGVLRTVPNSLI